MNDIDNATKNSEGPGADVGPWFKNHLDVQFSQVETSFARLVGVLQRTRPEIYIMIRYCT